MFSYLYSAIIGDKAPKNKFDNILENEGEDALVEAIWKDVFKAEDIEQFRGLDFDFECLALEGGGVKGGAYPGGIKVLDELGILKKIKRVSGTSAGAFVALQVVLGLSADEIVRDSVIGNFKDRYLDGSSLLKMPINIAYSYGWNSGNNLRDEVEKVLEKYVGKRKITFQELYKLTGKELCVVITDLNSRCAEYCHVKTTPGQDVAEAVRTSMALPVLYAPTVWKDDKMHRYFVDGAVLANYPIGAFDGWYLSMEPDDRFFKKIQEDPNLKFAGFNKKTLGMVVFSHGEKQSNNAAEFLERYGKDLLTGRPDSPLSKEREYTRDATAEVAVGANALDKSARNLVLFLAQQIEDEGDDDGCLSLTQFLAAVDKMKADPDLRKDLITLLGSVDSLTPLEKAFTNADNSGDRKLSMVECLNYLQSRGVYLRYNLQARYPQKIESITSYFTSIMSVMMSYISDMQQKPEDNERTIGIYTDYVTTSDFDVDYEDKVYLIRQGYKATISYLAMIKKDRKL